MKLIVGLGNPEDKYKNTYHNIGFTVVDLLAQRLDVKFKNKECKAVTCEKFIDGEKIIIAKPITYMNLSGECVREFVGKYKLESKDVIIVYDDLDIPKGNIRIRSDGSAGTHNGLKNIVACLGSTSFPRIRVGIQRENKLIPLIDYVLANLTKLDVETIGKALENAVFALDEFIKGDSIEKLMQKYN